MINTVAHDFVLAAAKAGANSGHAVDLWARGIGSAGFLLGVVSLIRSERRSLWERRAKVAQSVMTPLVELGDVLAASTQSPSAALVLWSITTHSNLEELDRLRRLCPQRRLRIQLRLVSASIERVRSLRQPTSDEASSGNPPLLSNTQLESIEEARQAYLKAKHCIESAIRKGGFSIR